MAGGKIRSRLLCDSSQETNSGHHEPSTCLARESHVGIDIAIAGLTPRNMVVAAVMTRFRNHAGIVAAIGQHKG